jgi:hypothetical protein
MINVTIWSPHYSSTQGHRTIISNLLDMFQRIDGYHATLTTSRDLRHEARAWDSVDSKRVLLIDWPYAEVALMFPHELHSHVDKIIGLQMFSSPSQLQLERTLIKAGVIDEVWSVEANPHTGADYSVELSPLVHGDCFATTVPSDLRDAWRAATRGRGGVPALLVMQTGDHFEREVIATHAMDTYPDHLIVPSRSLRLARPTRCAPIADRVLATTGYSTFWELAAICYAADDSLFDRVSWMSLDRPLEDVTHRLITHASPAMRTERFLLPTIATKAIALKGQLGE